MMMPVALDQVLGDQGSQGQDARRSVTARIGDQVGRRNPFAKQLRQPVDGRAQALGIGVSVAVPVGVDLGVGQAVIGTQVDDPHAALAQGGDDGHARGMRQGQEREGCSLGDPVGVEDLAGEVDPPRQAGMQRIQPRRLVLTRCRGRDPDVRMAQQDPDQLARRVSRRPHDRHADFRRHVMPRSDLAPARACRARFEMP